MNGGRPFEFADRIRAGVFALAACGPSLAALVMWLRYRRSERTPRQVTWSWGWPLAAVGADGSYLADSLFRVFMFLGVLWIGAQPLIWSRRVGGVGGTAVSPPNSR